jgi:hypothetical protein
MWKLDFLESKNMKLDFNKVVFNDVNTKCGLATKISFMTKSKNGNWIYCNPKMETSSRSEFPCVVW